MARCTGKTVKKTRCKSKALSGLKRCGRHTTAKRKKPAAKHKSVKRKKPAAKRKPTAKRRTKRKAPKYSKGKNQSGYYSSFVGTTDKGNLSAKFWTGKVVGNKVVTHHGKMGTKGRTTTTTYKSPAAARKALAARKRSKANKGYFRRRRNPGLISDSSSYYVQEAVSNPVDNQYWDSYTGVQLLKLCRDLGISCNNKMTKAQLKYRLVRYYGLDEEHNRHVERYGQRRRNPGLMDNMGYDDDDYPTWSNP